MNKLDSLGEDICKVINRHAMENNLSTIDVIEAITIVQLLLMKNIKIKMEGAK